MLKGQITQKWKCRTAQKMFSCKSLYPQANTVMSGSWTNHSFESVHFGELVHHSRLMFIFLHWLIVSLHKTSIYNQESQAFILCSLICFFFFLFSKTGSHRLTLYVSVLFYRRTKVTYISHGLRVNKLTAHFHFGVNCPFKCSSWNSSATMY